MKLILLLVAVHTLIFFQSHRNHTGNLAKHEPSSKSQRIKKPSTLLVPAPPDKKTVTDVSYNDPEPRLSMAIRARMQPLFAPVK
jgi:hypothetical protein